MKNLSNDQRTRLEKIAQDEFSIREKEIREAKDKEFRDWHDKEVKKVQQSADYKQLAKLLQDLEKVEKRLKQKGIQVNYRMGYNYWNCFQQAQIERIALQNSYPGMENMQKKTKVDTHALTRAKNEVLSVIWSMEQSFDQCVKLIYQKVKKVQ